jgi:hypothetical protein
MEEYGEDKIKCKDDDDDDRYLLVSTAGPLAGLDEDSPPEMLGRQPSPPVAATIGDMPRPAGSNSGRSDVTAACNGGGEGGVAPGKAVAAAAGKSGLLLRLDYEKAVRAINAVVGLDRRVPSEGLASGGSSMPESPQPPSPAKSNASAGSPHSLAFQSSLKRKL